MDNPAPPQCPQCSPTPWTHEGRRVRDALGHFLFKVFIDDATEAEMILVAAFIVALANAAIKPKEKTP